jgi:MFS superfamily sulfate permease-like transporter
VSVVGILPQGFPRPSLPIVGWADIALLFAAAVGISLVAIGDTISTSAGFAARKGYEVNSNQELLGIGTANLLAGVFQGFPVSTSGSRTAVAEQSGAKTQLTGLVAAGAVLAMLVFLPGLVRNLPQSALAAIIIAASIRLFDAAEFWRLLVMRRSEFVLAVASLLGVAFVGVLEGIVIAVVLSVLDFFRRAWRPYSAVLGQVDGMEGYHDVSRYPDAHRIPGLVILRWNAPLFFANSSLFRDLIRQLVVQSQPKPFWILVSAEPVTDIDTSAADVLVDLDMELNSQGIHLVFAELKDPVKDKIVSYGLLETIDQRHFYATIQTAVAAFRNEVMTHRPELLGQDKPAAPAGRV